MKKFFAIVAVLMITVLMITGCSDDSSKDGNSRGDTLSTTAATAAANDKPVNVKETNTFTIKTKYGDLKYPEQWKDKIKTVISEEEPYTVAFMLKDGKAKIFALHFGGGEGYLLGTLEKDGKQVEVFVDDAELDPKSKNYDMYCEMQEDVNVILQNLINDYGFNAGTGQSSTPSKQEDTESGNKTYEINTSLATLNYPVKWKDKVTVKDEDNIVAFYSGDVELFEFRLGGEEGFSVGTYMGKDLRLVTFSFDKYKDNKERFEELCAMQEDANIIITSLAKDSNFSAE